MRVSVFRWFLQATFRRHLAIHMALLIPQVKHSGLPKGSLIATRMVSERTKEQVITLGIHKGKALARQTQLVKQIPIQRLMDYHNHKALQIAKACLKQRVWGKLMAFPNQNLLVAPILLAQATPMAKRNPLVAAKVTLLAHRQPLVTQWVKLLGKPKALLVVTHSASLMAHL